MNTQPTHKCATCNTIKPTAEMETAKKNGVVYLRGRCKKCGAERHRQWRISHPDRARNHDRRSAFAAATRRRAPENLPQVLYNDLRTTDRKAGRAFDLNVEMIATLIANGCSYCGEHALRMSLDRVDNARGHTPDNVVPACIRCNYTRGTMPYAAWLLVAAGMRQARATGAFGGWIGDIPKWKHRHVARREAT